MSASDLLNEADANQARAADPSASAWVSANAGTGKTEVLVRRGLRLLLAGAAPERILCLTYTKAAAAEMENRLLKELAAWATIQQPDLSARIEALTGRAPDEAVIHAARRLFASTLDAKGGLKIYTIHGFCERLLQRFPLEAGVTPHFTVLDERGALLLRNAAFDAVLGRAASNREGPLGNALAKIIARAGEEQFRGVIDMVLSKRTELIRIIWPHERLEDWAEAECASLKRVLGVEQDREQDLLAELRAILPNATIDALMLDVPSDPNADDTRLREGLEAARSATGEARIAALKSIFCTDKGEQRKRVCSGTMRRAAPGICAMLDDAQTRFIYLDQRLALLRTAEASAAVLMIADAVHGEYGRRKRAEAALDYDDLILKTGNLLSRAGAASWVLYKMDRGIDHILVDEAQDTNPEQWAIIQGLADEFFAGEGASERVRTLFAVGDEKQSIYSFQGAEPARFGEAGVSFRRKAEAAGLVWHAVPLNVSFRSTVAILDAVDAVFARAEAARGVTWQGAAIKHYSFRQGQAGRVELWEVEKEDKADPAPAFEPWNEPPSAERSVEVLCRRIASTIKGWIEAKEPLESQGRPIRPGDILILVTKRNPFIAPMIRALKRLKVPVAGADRMRLSDQLAVQDLIALADFLLMQQDDLALANVLKSPLFNFDDDALFALAHARGGAPLWSALNSKASSEARFAEAHGQLTAWLSRVDFLPPYEFFSELLGADGQKMRKRMLTRLGPEAAEAIDELLDLALGFDREAPPSLQGFIDMVRAGDVDIKRDMEQERDEVRIMTVHGAKGLQAPIVFLPDTCMPPQRQGTRLYTLPRPEAPPDEAGHLIWPAANQSHAAIDAAKIRSRDAEMEEYHRLLYVAMTRARDRLYVCGWQGVREREQGCWHNLVNDGLAGHLTKMEGTDGKPLRRMASEQSVPVSGAKEARPGVSPVPLPDWARRPAPFERARRELQPSRLAAHLAAEEETAQAEQPPLGPKALAEDQRYLRGRLVHSLLQYLPEIGSEERMRAARAFVAARGSGLDERIRAEVVAESLAIVEDARFAPIFGKGSLAEVPIVARFGEGRDALPISGQIDRLAVLDDRLLVLDYKTNRPPPLTLEAVAPAYLRQLAAYRLALRRMFPGKTVEAALLWADGPRLMEIPSTLLDDTEREMLEGAPKP